MATALELGRKGWKRYLEGARRHLHAPGPTPDEQREFEHILDRVRKATSVLKERFGVRRVLLFGSLAHVGWFVPDSDVDLVVEGLAAEYYWEAWRVVEEIIEDRPVDLIEVETARDSLQRAIRRYGVEL